MRAKRSKVKPWRFIDNPYPGYARVKAERQFSQLAMPSKPALISAKGRGGKTL